MIATDLFGPVPMKPRRRLMYAVDAGNLPDGNSAAQFQCRACGHDSGWIYASPRVAVRGVPCPHCNADPAPTATPADLFSRQRRPGCDAWGNEVEKFGDDQ